MMLVSVLLSRLSGCSIHGIWQLWAQRKLVSDAPQLVSVQQSSGLGFRMQKLK